MRGKDALKGWTTCEDLLSYRRGILPFPQILERVSLPQGLTKFVEWRKVFGGVTEKRPM